MFHNNLPFQVILYLGGTVNQFVQSYNLSRFSLKQDEIVEEPINIIEYQPLEIEFIAVDSMNIPENAKMYLDGMDTIDMRVLWDWQGSYIKCNQRLCLYNRNNPNMEYPWIPGFYRVAVVWGQERYYTMLQIKPRNVTDNQLTIMRNELEKTMRGIALEMVLRHKGIGSSDNLINLPERLYPYSLLEEQFP